VNTRPGHPSGEKTSTSNPHGTPSTATAGFITLLLFHMRREIIGSEVPADLFKKSLPMFCRQEEAKCAEAVPYIFTRINADESRPSWLLNDADASCLEEHLRFLLCRRLLHRCLVSGKAKSLSIKLSQLSQPKGSARSRCGARRPSGRPENRTAGADSSNVATNQTTRMVEGR